jgi:N utilization substance protein B
MKTSHDPRHKRRQHIIQQLFSLQFHNQKASDYAKAIINNKHDLDMNIQKAAPEFPVDKINRVDLAILRLAAYEIMLDKKEPRNVIIDEAVELAKEFGNDKSPGFVNGVLGKIITNEQAS